MQSRSSTSAFGNRASFSDLWTANVEALGRAYPDAAGRPYDCSAADAALAAHLAFWTGADCQRILKIMQRPECGLQREKYERPDYLQRTILVAVARCTEVCNDRRHTEEAKRRQEQIEENILIGGGSDLLPLAGEIALEEMLRDSHP